jgi:hypothetical protein
MMKATPRLQEPRRLVWEVGCSSNAGHINPDTDPRRREAPEDRRRRRCYRRSDRPGMVERVIELRGCADY